MPTENISLAKKERSLRRLLAFKLKRSNPPTKSLNVCKAVSVNIFPSAPKKILSISQVQITDIPPCPETNSSVQTSPYIHPNIVVASKMLYGKPPWELEPDQVEHFEGYQEYKKRNGRPIETDLVYKPRDSFY